MIYTFLKHKNLLSSIIAFLSVIQLAAQEEVLVDAEQMPYFIGCSKYNDNPDEKRTCSNENLIRFISNQLVYPGSAKEQGIEGTVYVSFVVDEEGNVVSPNVIRDIGGGCGEAALEILNNMPRWEPAIHEGEKVKVKLNLPIRYAFKNDEESEKASLYQINWGNLVTNTVSKEELESQLDKKLHVRDSYGDDKTITELIFAFEKKRHYLEGSSTGKINDELKKIVKKCKQGGTFHITVVIQVEGEFIFVKRQFKII
jgi:TonB family protein